MQLRPRRNQVRPQIADCFDSEAHKSAAMAHAAHGGRRTMRFIERHGNGPAGFLRALSELALRVEN